MSGVNHNLTNAPAIAGVFAQFSNGTDQTTDLYSAVYAPIPIFTSEEFGNYSSEFTKNSTTELQVNFDGILWIGAVMLIQYANEERSLMTARVYKNGSAVGPTSGVSYMRSTSSSTDESACVLNRFFMPVADGDLIELRAVNTFNNVTTTTFYGNNLSYIILTRVG